MHEPEMDFDTNVLCGFCVFNPVKSLVATLTIHIFRILFIVDAVVLSSDLHRLSYKNIL